MKRLLLIVLPLLLIVGCTYKRLLNDYYGNSIYLAENGVALKDIERDETNPDIFYLEIWQHPRKPILVKKGLRKTLYKIKNDFGYFGFHVLSEHYKVTAWDEYAIYEIQFTRTQEDFEKLDRYLKN